MRLLYPTVAAVLTDELLSLAFRALDDGSAPGELYLALVTQLHTAHAGDQKEIAAALQTLARRVESERNAESAFEFKQRSCETLLRVNLEARLAARAGAPLHAQHATVPQPAAKSHRDAPGAAQAKQPGAGEPGSVAADLLEKGKAAVRALDDGPMVQLIEDLDRQHCSNQREVAASLQQIARALESESSADAIAFKQLSCAAMLKLSMQARRRSRAQS